MPEIVSFSSGEQIRAAPYEEDEGGEGNAMVTSADGIGTVPVAQLSRSKKFIVDAG